MQNQEDFTFTLLSDRTPAEVYAVIINVRNWWSGIYDESFEGSSENPGDEFAFTAGGGAHYSRQKLIEAIPNQKIIWLVTESNLSFLGDPEEWKGTKISFDISTQKGQTKIVFTHTGLVPQIECYNSCASAWMQYLEQRLVRALETKS